MRANAYTMSRLVQKRSRCLIALVGPHAYPSTIRAVGSGSARAIVRRWSKARNAGQSRPVVCYAHDRLRDALIFFIATTFMTPCNIPLRQGVHTQHVAITHLIISGHSISTDVIESTGAQVVEAINASAVFHITSRARVGYGGFRIGVTIAEALLEDVGGRVHRRTTEDGRCSTGIPLIRGDAGHTAG